MSTQIETMRVKCPITEDNDQGFYIINKEDFDAEKHEAFDAAETPKQDEAPAAKPSWAAQA